MKWVRDIERASRHGRMWPPGAGASLSLDGLLAAVAHVLTAWIARGPSDEERRRLELERMELENEKLRAEIEVLRAVEVVASEEDDEDDEDDADGEE